MFRGEVKDTGVFVEDKVYFHKHCGFGRKGNNGRLDPERG